LKWDKGDLPIATSSLRQLPTTAILIRSSTTRLYDSKSPSAPATCPTAALHVPGRPSLGDSPPAPFSRKLALRILGRKLHFDWAARRPSQRSHRPRNPSLGFGTSRRLSSLRSSCPSRKGCQPLRSFCGTYRTRLFLAAFNGPPSQQLHLRALTYSTSRFRIQVPPISESQQCLRPPRMSPISTRSAFILSLHHVPTLRNSRSK
jgi:hypothetical protein